jgi:GT2 family glycosyltransferase
VSVLAIVPVYLRDHLDAELLARCLVSLYSTAPEAEVLVVDDGSPAEHLVDQLAPVADELGQRLHLKEDNSGFSKTVNVGLRTALEEGHDALLVNQDIQFVEPGWLESMLACRDDAGRPAAVVGGRLLYPTGLIQHAGIYYSRFYGWFDHRFRYGPADLAEANVRFACPVTGALQLIRHDVLEQVGIYDETFLMGYEDVDYCLRTFDSGLSCVYEPAAWAYHHESAIRGRLDEKSRSWWEASNERHLSKNGDRDHSPYYTSLT